MKDLLLKNTRSIIERLESADATNFIAEMVGDIYSEFGYEKYTDDFSELKLREFISELNNDDTEDLKALISGNMEIVERYSNHELSVLKAWNEDMTANYPGKVRLNEFKKCSQILKNENIEYVLSDGVIEIIQ